MRKLQLVLGIGLLATFLALGPIACGDDEDENGGNGEPTATESANGGSATVTPENGG